MSNFATRLITFTFGLMISVNSANAANMITNDQVQKTMNTVMHKYGIPGVTVILYKNGQIQHYTFGVMKNKSTQPITNQTLFELGSVTKSFSGLLLAQQVNEKNISLNDKLTDYLSNSESTTPSIKEITLLELATHSSGLPDDAPNLAYNAALTAKNTKTLNLFLRTWKRTYPGSLNTFYSNLGFSLLGQALANHEGTSLDSVMQNNILNPLGMHNSFLTVPLTSQKYYAEGYTSSGTPARTPQAGLLSGSWAMKSSGNDMAKYLLAAIGIDGTPDNILKGMQRAQTAYFQPQGRTWALGLGWLITPLNNADIKELLKVTPMVAHKRIPIPIKPIATPHYEGHALIEKTGATNGFRAYIGVIPDQKIGVVILINRFIFDSYIIEHTGHQFLFNQ